MGEGAGNPPLFQRPAPSWAIPLRTEKKNHPCRQSFSGPSVLFSEATKSNAKEKTVRDITGNKNDMAKSNADCDHWQTMPQTPTRGGDEIPGGTFHGGR